MTCIIIEDELPAQRILKNYISKLPEIELNGSFQSALEANTVLRNEHIDILFLDIQLPDISGIQFIKTLTDPPSVIMTTAYHEHAVESFELDTICDYLVKPFSFERFLKAVNKTKKVSRFSLLPRYEKNTSKSTFLNIDKTLHKIDIDTILYIESDKNYVTVVTKSGRFSYLDSLKNWVKKLPESQFVQVHKSYIINYGEIDRIVGNTITVNKEKIPVGRVYRPTLLELLKLS